MPDGEKYDDEAWFFSLIRHSVSRSEFWLIRESWRRLALMPFLFRTNEVLEVAATRWIGSKIRDEKPTARFFIRDASFRSMMDSLTSLHFLKAAFVMRKIHTFNIHFRENLRLAEMDSTHGEGIFYICPACDLVSSKWISQERAIISEFLCPKWASSVHLLHRVAWYDECDLHVQF